MGQPGLGSTSLGKSGKMIERLMAENDRLRREINSERTKREELQRAAQTQKSNLESLQAENYRLSNIKSLDDGIIKRRDRKIDELKAELAKHHAIERHLESRAEEAERERDDRVQRSERAIQLAVEEARHSTTHAAILTTSHAQLRNEYTQRAATLNRTVKELHAREEENRTKLGKLDVVNNKMRHEAERIRKAHAEQTSAEERFHEEKDREVDALKRELSTIKDTAAERERNVESKLSDMHELMNQMKWLINLQKLADGNPVVQRIS